MKGSSKTYGERLTGSSRVTSDNNVINCRQHHRAFVQIERLHHGAESMILIVNVLVLIHNIIEPSLL